MFTSGRPLLDTTADARFFIDRDAEMSALQHAVTSRLNAIVLGTWGSGKTSLLRQFTHRLRAERLHKVEFLDATIATEALPLLALISERVLGPEVRPALPLATHAAGWGYEVAQPSPTGKLLQLIDRLRRELPMELAQPPADEHGPAWDPDEPLIICLDGAKPAAVQTLFGSLRDEVWSLPVVWLVTGDEASRAAYLQPPADTFFEVRISLGSFTIDDAVALLSTRIDQGAISRDLLRRLASSLSEPTPRELVAAIRELLQAPGAAEATVDAAARERNQRNARLAALGRGAAMLAAELQARGGSASASDPALLNALGWSRPRAAQVFRQLEDAGLVTASELRGEGAGRPRKIYELVGPVW